MTTDDKAKRAPVAIGQLSVDGFQMPDGSYRMSQTQAAESVGLSERNAREFLQSKSLKALMGELGGSGGEPPWKQDSSASSIMNASSNSFSDSSPRENSKAGARWVLGVMFKVKSDAPGAGVLRSSLTPACGVSTFGFVFAGVNPIHSFSITLPTLLLRLTPVLGEGDGGPLPRPMPAL